VTVRPAQIAFLDTTRVAIGMNLLAAKSPLSG
jgi:hypothetical protein